MENIFEGKCAEQNNNMESNWKKTGLKNSKVREKERCGIVNESELSDD